MQIENVHVTNFRSVLRTDNRSCRCSVVTAVGAGMVSSAMPMCAPAPEPELYIRPIRRLSRLQTVFQPRESASDPRFHRTDGDIISASKFFPREAINIGAHEHLTAIGLQ